MSEITRETFEKASASVQRGMLFDKCCAVDEKLDKFDKRLVKKAMVDKVYLTVFGFVGGLFSRWIKW